MVNRPGWTLLELLFVVGIVGLLLGLALPRASQSTSGLADDAARLFAKAVRSARADAVARAGVARIEIAPPQEEIRGGRYRVGSVASGGDVMVLDQLPWIDLDKELRLAPGMALRDPFGGVPVGLSGPTVIWCDATGACDTGEDPIFIVYFTHSQSEDRPSAVGITEQGGVHMFRHSAEGWR